MFADGSKFVSALTGLLPVGDRPQFVDGVKRGRYARRISHSTTATMPMTARIAITIPMGLSPFLR